MSESSELLPPSLRADLRSHFESLVGNYPVEGRQSVLLPLLHHAQDLCGGWLPQAAMDEVATILDMAPIRVYEVATFHTMFHKHPMPRHCIGFCTSLPCWLCGAHELMAACRRRLGVTTTEGMSASQRIYVMEQECLGACIGAPVVTVDGVYHERVDGEGLESLLTVLEKGDAERKG